MRTGKTTRKMRQQSRKRKGCRDHDWHSKCTRSKLFWCAQSVIVFWLYKLCIKKKFDNRSPHPSTPTMRCIIAWCLLLHELHLPSYWFPFSSSQAEAMEIKSQVRKGKLKIPATCFTAVLNATGLCLNFPNFWHQRKWSNRKRQARRALEECLSFVMQSSGLLTLL